MRGGGGEEGGGGRVANNTNNDDMGEEQISGRMLTQAGVQEFIRTMTTFCGVTGHSNGRLRMCQVGGQEGAGGWGGGMGGMGGGVLSQIFRKSETLARTSLVAGYETKQNSEALRHWQGQQLTSNTLGIAFLPIRCKHRYGVHCVTTRAWSIRNHADCLGTRARRTHRHVYT